MRQIFIHNMGFLRGVYDNWHRSDSSCERACVYNVYIVLRVLNSKTLAISLVKSLIDYIYQYFKGQNRHRSLVLRNCEYIKTVYFTYPNQSQKSDFTPSRTSSYTWGFSQYFFQKLRRVLCKLMPSPPSA